MKLSDTKFNWFSCIPLYLVKEDLDGFSLFLFIDLEFNLTEFLDLNFLLLSSHNKEVFI